MSANSDQQTENQTPVPHNWGKDLQAKMKHLEMIQAVITRMANNSFMIKGWCITLVSALLAFAVGKDGNPLLIAIAFLPVLMFWYLDGFFLQQERHFRNFYNQEVTTENTDFRITPPNPPTETVWTVMKRPTLKVFYGWTLAIVLITAVLLLILVKTGTLSIFKQSESQAGKPAVSPTPTSSKNSSTDSLPSPLGYYSDSRVK